MNRNPGERSKVKSLGTGHKDEVRMGGEVSIRS
jgi:hypothetical protein